MAQGTLRRSGGANHGRGLSPAATLVRLHDRDRFQTALFAPAEHREALFALYAFNFEIARVRESISEPMLGEIRLQWWREALDAAYSGVAPRRHEIVMALDAAIRPGRLSREHFMRLIDARQRDLDPEPPANFAALEAYAEASSAPLIVLALEALDAATPPAREAARDIGIAYALSGIVRALPHLTLIGRAVLPDEIARGLDPGALGSAKAAPVVREAVVAIVAAAKRRLAAARGRRRELPARALPALLPATVAAGWLRRIERSGFDPFTPGWAKSDPLQPWRLTAAALLRRY
jgi:NADH dehydrogenase [ubiquinone] 1 alpha subcomplex assembly factor 6